MPNDQLARDVEVKRRALRDAAAKYGAEANKRNRNSARVAELGVALEAAAKAFAHAELRLHDEMRAEREAGAAS